MSLHRWLVGFVLVLFMLAALTANAVMFSARSFQHNLAQIVPETGGVLSIASLEANDAKIQELETLVAPQRGSAVEAAVRLEQAQAALRESETAVAAAYAGLDKAIAAIEARYGLADAGAEGADPETLELRINGLQAVRRPSPEDAAAIDAARQALAETRVKQEAQLALLDEIEAAEAAQRAAASDVADVQRQILGLKSQYGESYDRIRNEAMSLKPLAFTEALVGLHPTFLSTMLVLLMGALGAVLFLFPAYLSRSIEVTFVVIIVRTVFGMVTALAFYIVANATLAGFTLSAGGDGSASALSLNPFTVSLLGIIAGVMADDIAGWIHARGRDILGGGKPPTLAPPPSPAESYPASGPGAMGLMANPFSSAAVDAARVGAPEGFADDEIPRGGRVERD